MDNGDHHRRVVNTTTGEYAASNGDSRSPTIHNPKENPSKQKAGQVMRESDNRLMRTTSGVWHNLAACEAVVLLIKGRTQVQQISVISERREGELISPRRDWGTEWQVCDQVGMNESVRAETGK